MGKGKSLNIKKGDTVKVIAGKDKGAEGKVIAVNRETERVIVETDKVVVEGINLIKRHMRPTPRNPQGGILEKEAAMHACKVMPVDPKTGKGTRVRFKTDDKGNKTRVAKSGEELVVLAQAE